MTNRYRAYLNTLLHEDPTLSGVVVRDSNGAYVRWGINAASWPGYDVHTITLVEALHTFYPAYFPRHLDAIESQLMVNATYDVEFNSGRGHGVHALQLAAGVVVDGVIGPQTIAAVNADLAGVRMKLQQTISAHYHAIAEHNPADAKYLDEWLERVDSNFRAEV